MQWLYLASTKGTYTFKSGQLGKASSSISLMIDYSVSNFIQIVLKEFALEEINKCLTAVFNGQPYFSPKLLDEIDFVESMESLNKLTVSEKTILTQIAANQIGKEIAENLSISVRTVEKHKSTIRQKLGLDSKPATLYLFAYTHKKLLEAR